MARRSHPPRGALRTGGLLALLLLAMVLAILVFRSFWSIEDSEGPEPLRLPTDAEWGERVGELLALGDTEGARRQWIAWNASGNRMDEEFRLRQNEIWNGGFELELAGAPLGWRIPDSADVQVQQVTSLAREGRVLRLELGGRGAGICDLRQQVLVEAGARYLLSFSVRSEALDISEGLRVEALDARGGATLYTSLPLEGSVGWQGSLGSLDVPETTSRIWLRVCSPSSVGARKRPASGRLWLDSFVLQKVAGG